MNVISKLISVYGFEIGIEIDILLFKFIKRQKKIIFGSWRDDDKQFV